MCVLCVFGPAFPPSRLPPDIQKSVSQLSLWGSFSVSGMGKIGERLSMKRGRFLPALDSLNFICR